eukprot:c17667_g1_i3.p1 GENE.c17667_g1_i3~~c17667_g1_i3.p1  ORF type:complete len:353 (+),score=169.81 c17667_g1_i3:22-1059(+)
MSSVAFRRARIGIVGVFGVGLAVYSQTQNYSYTQNSKKKLPSELVFAGVEGGGTTWKVGIAKGDPTNIVERCEFDTTTPEETLGQIKKWLNQRNFDAIGIASFGPVDLHQSSETFGYITTTPKHGWQNTNVVGPLIKGIENIPYQFDTDVNAPALAEFKLNRQPNETSCAYVTVGTGIGVGLVINGQCVHGLTHPEGGHVSVPILPNDPKKDYNPSLPFGGKGAETMANSLSIASRTGVPLRELHTISDNDPVWDHVSYYLASLCSNMILLVSPERIVLSGGVMQRHILFPKIRKHVKELLNGYVSDPKILTDQIDNYIVPSKYENNIGLIGALVLAQEAYNKKN